MFKNNDTIFAPITSVNQSGVCVIRISGKETLNCLKHLGVNQSKISSQKISFHKIFDLHTKEIIDECLISFFKAPKSFTGEDIAEISIHASNYIFHKISNILSKIDSVRMAEAGEFSKRAFLNNKINLIEAEAIIDLISSETELQHKQAIKQLSGEVGKIYNNLRQDIIKSSALIEAAIDFADEDLPKTIIDDINENIKKIKLNIENIINDNKTAQKIKNGLSLAIIGKPNVGKSTLINLLANSEIAIVSNVAGTTRDVIETHLNIADIVVKIADTAGIRESKNKIEQEGIKRAVNKAKIADIKILIIEANDQEISQEIKNLIDNNTIILINKIDRIKNYHNNKLNLPKLSSFDNIIEISLKNHINIDLLKLKLKELVKLQIPCINSSIITNERHRNSLQKALHYLDDFSLDKPIELAAEDLRLASYEIGKITGQIDIENILDVIFSSFCIGK